MNRVVTILGRPSQNASALFPDAELVADVDALLGHIRGNPGAAHWVAIAHDTEDPAAIAVKLREADPSLNVIILDRLIAAEGPTMMPRVAERIAGEFGLSRDEVTPSATLQGDLGLDRYDVLEFLEVLELEYGVSISNDAATSATVADLERALTDMRRTAAA